MKSSLNILLRVCIALSAICTCWPGLVIAQVVEDDVLVDNSKFVVQSSRRVGRTVKEYTLTAVAKNNGTEDYENVTADLSEVPGNVTIVDGNLSFGSINNNESVTSSDTFVIRVNLRIKASLFDMKWTVSGDVVEEPPPDPPTPSPDEAGIFLDLTGGGIEGEVDNSSHENWIELLSWNEGWNNPAISGIGGDREGSNFSVDDVLVSKWVDSTSPLLRVAVAKGTHFEDVRIDIVSSCDGNLYTEYALTFVNVLLTSVSVAGAQGDSSSPESVSISPNAIVSIYTPVTEDCRLMQPIYSYRVLY